MGIRAKNNPLPIHHGQSEVTEERGEKATDEHNQSRSSDGDDLVQGPTDAKVPIEGDGGDQKGRVENMSGEKAVEFTEIFLMNT